MKLLHITSQTKGLVRIRPDRVDVIHQDTELPALTAVYLADGTLYRVKESPDTVELLWAQAMVAGISASGLYLEGANSG